MNSTRSISSPHLGSHRRRREIDLLAVGEVLVDLIGEEPAAGLGTTKRFRRHAGGSVANLAANLARLGNRVALVARVGDDGLGRFLRRNLEAAGVETETVAVDRETPTSLVAVSRGDGTAEFVAYRGADARIEREQIRDDLVDACTLYHTSCFALARQPARAAILEAARRAVTGGAHLSLDTNYAPSVWPDRQEAQEVVAGWCRHGTLVKTSTDDVARLFAGTALSAAAAAARFHGWGAELVCVTEGSRGTRVSWDGGRRQERVAAPPVVVADATGAGDAFWAGFLTAWLDGREPPECARAGSRLAALKLAVVGPLAGPIGREVLYEG